jgi:hypothetical protein
MAIPFDETKFRVTSSPVAPGGGGKTAYCTVDWIVKWVTDQRDTESGPKTVSVDFKSAAHRKSIEEGFANRRFTEIPSVYTVLTVKETAIEDVGLTDDQTEAFNHMSGDSRSLYMKSRCASIGTVQVVFYSV